MNFNFEVFSQTSNERIFRNLGSVINSNSDEFQPVIFNDTLYFRRTDKSSKQDNDIFFIAVKDITCPSAGANKLSPVQLYQLKTIKPKELLMFNSSPAFLIFNTSEAFENNLEKSVNQKMLNSEFNDIHPTISKDGQVMVFASDRAGEHTNTDLYVSIRKNDGTWAAPKILSSGINGINTPENEITPYIADDGTLYYASKGFTINNTEYYFSATEAKSKTKSDIYKTTAKINYNIVRAEAVPGTKGSWRNPKVLNEPFNTKWDDIGPALYSDKNSGENLLFLSSNRQSDNKWGDSYGTYDLYGYCLEKCIDCYDSCEKFIVEGFVDIECTNINDYPGKIKVYTKNKDSMPLITEFFVSNKGGFSWIVPYPYDRNLIFEYNHPCLEESIFQEVKIPCIKRNKYNCPDCSLKQGEIQKVMLDTFAVGHPCCCKPVEIDIQLNCYNRKKKGMLYQITNFDNKIVATGNVDKKGKIKVKLEYSEKFNVSVFFKCMEKEKFSVEITPECSKYKIKKYEDFIFIPWECCCTADTLIKEKYEMPFFVTGYYYPTTRLNYFDLKNKLKNNFKNNPNVKYIDTADYDYESTIREIEKIFLKISESLRTKINDDECFCSKFEVKIVGFADQRSIAGGKNALFDDEIQIDNDIQILNNITPEFLSSKPQMTNDLLSVLRAYNTALILKTLTDEYITEETTQIKWVVEGKGIDNTSTDLEKKRKINIYIQCIE